MILPELSLVLDILIACLLVAVIVYALRLNKNLSVLQQSKSELEKMLAGFTESTEKAEMAIQKVKDASTQNRDSLNKLLGEAEALREDLAYMIERGNSLADKLDGGIAQNRGGAEKSAAPKGRDDDIETAMRAARHAAGTGERKSLAVKPEDRDSATGAGPNLPATTGTPKTQGESGADNGSDGSGKAKSKSALLRALQGMR